MSNLGIFVTTVILLTWYLGLSQAFIFPIGLVRDCRNPISVNIAERNSFLLVRASAKRKSPNQRVADSDDHDEETLGSDAPEDIDEEEQLVLDFIEMAQTTPAGELELDEVDLLREIMSQYANDKTTAVEGIETAQIVETLLVRLVAEWKAAIEAKDKEKEEAFRPTAADFEITIQAWGASKNPDRIIRLLSILSDQRELFMTGHPDLRPSLSSIKTILTSLADSRERGIDKRATQIFDSLEEFGLKADPEVYGLMVLVIAKSKAPRAAQRAEQLLRDGVKLFPPGLGENGKFTGIGVDAFNAVVVAYAKSGLENGPQKAEELIAYMDQVDSESGAFGICSPNVKTFTSLIDAYCQQNEWESVSQADRILNRLLDQYLEGNEDLEPSVATWTIVISAWGRLSKKNRRGASDRAGRLLRRMEELHRSGRISCKPDAITYVTCMNAYVFSRGGEDAGEAEKILDQMNENYLDGDDSMKPSPRSVRLVADAWIKSGDMASAEQFLDDYEEYLYGDDKFEEGSDYTAEMYRSMLFGYTQQGNMDKARSYLDLMIEKDLKPDNICFDRMIEGYTKANTPNSLKQSLQVFELVEKCRRKGDLNPNERVYTSFIRALTKGRAADMHVKAETLLKRMEKLYGEGNADIKPTIFSYNAVLNACAESIHVEGTSHDEAFKTAIRLFTTLRNGPEKLDHVTFGNMLRCARLLPEGEKRDKYTTATFQLCCQQGLVNNFVVRDLQMVSTEELWRSLLNVPQGEPEVDLLPSSWRSRLDDGKQRSNYDTVGGRQRSNYDGGRRERNQRSGGYDKGRSERQQGGRRNDWR